MYFVSVGTLPSISFRLNKNQSINGAFGCFYCKSVNNDNPACDDPFNATLAYEAGLYQESCMTGMKGRDGLFPGSACVKVKGYYSKILYDT